MVWRLEGEGVVLRQQRRVVRLPDERLLLRELQPRNGVRVGVQAAHDAAFGRLGNLLEVKTNIQEGNVLGGLPPRKMLNVKKMGALRLTYAIS